MDFHLYHVKILRSGNIDITVDRKWKQFYCSYSSGVKKEMRQLKQIVKRLYLYYGVTEEDIEWCSIRRTHGKRNIIIGKSKVI